MYKTWKKKGLRNNKAQCDSARYLIKKKDSSYAQSNHNERVGKPLPCECVGKQV